MSWDADLNVKVDGHDLCIRSWNYTHNCNCMAAAVLEDHGYELEQHWLIGHMGKSWFDRLDGLGGRDGAELLDLIVTGLERDPERFRAMNPANGWGSYDSLLDVLREMRTVSREYSSAAWRVSD